MTWFTSFLYSQLFITPPVPTKDFSGQTIIVTGANTGLGLEAALHLSRLHTSLLILAVRTPSKGHAAKTRILSLTHRPESSIQVWELDMQSPSSIAAFTTRVNALPRLDAVLANAGIGTKHWRMVCGYESTIMTNVIGTFLLVLGVLPKLRESAERFGQSGRLAVVGSDLHFIARFPERRAEDVFQALGVEGRGDLAMEGYAISKLIQVLAIRSLAALVPSSSVIINTMTPGACKSDFHRENSGVSKLIHAVMEKAIARTAEVGSRTLVLALEAGEESHGTYMADGAVHEPGPLVQGANGEALQKKVWEQLLRELEKMQPGISKNI